MIFFLISLLITIVVTFSGIMIKKKIFLKKEKNTPFECGFDPFSLARQPFSLRFFSVAIIFLIFDVEIIILLPIPLLSNLTNITMIIKISSIILMIMLGLFYEWKNGMIQWL
nr:NADH dehydrogenase subunit 3 [Alectorobius spheniscus]